MESHEIRYFLALSGTLNFTKAAELCNVSQPALTRAIQKMEGELGGLLFSRERSNTHLTELGRMLKPHLEEVMAGAQAARETANRFLRLEGAPLSLGVMCSIGPLRFVSFLTVPRAAFGHRDHRSRKRARPPLRFALERRAGRGAHGSPGRVPASVARAKVVF